MRDRLSHFGPRNSDQWHNAGKKLPPEPLELADVRKIFEFLNNSSRSEILRAKAFVTICLRGLLRSSEALALFPKDVNLETGIVRVLCGKGRKSRVVGLDSKACSYTSEWIERRKELGIPEDSRLFCVVQGRHRGRPVQKSWPRNLMKRLQKNCGIAKRLHPHGLRHTGAVQMMNDGIPIAIISMALGHSNIATTHTYLNHLNPAAVISLMAKRPSW